MIFGGLIKDVPNPIDKDVISYAGYPYKPFQCLKKLFLEISELVESPKGRRFHLYWPNGVEKVVSALESSSKMQCQ